MALKLEMQLIFVFLMKMKLARPAETFSINNKPLLIILVFRLIHPSKNHSLESRTSSEV